MYDPTMRVLTVLEMLQARGRVTGAELARRLEVHPRTVQRYIARLQDLGIPVEGTRGVGGAYRLKPGFRLPPLMFTDEEALALSLGLRALRHLGLSAFAPAAEGAGAKLERVLPPAVGDRVREVQEAVDLDTSPWIVAADAKRVIELAAAVQARRLVALGYTSGDGRQTRRDVEPYGVVHHDGRWYLVGRCRLRETTRSFRVDRIVEAQVLEGTFDLPPGFDARAYLRGSLPFARSSWQVKVWLELPLEEARRRIPPSLALLEALDDGTMMHCGVENLEWLAAVLLSLGCPLIVHQPAELLEALRTLARRAQAVPSLLQ